MKTKPDFDNLVEHALNEENSEEDLVAEYVENELLEQDHRAGCVAGGCERDTANQTFLQRITTSFTETSCCSKNCCRTWKEEHLRTHAEDLEKLSKADKKLVLLTLLHNNARTSDHTRYSEQRQRLRFTFRFEPFGTMCASAFRLLFDIRIEAFKGLLAHLKTSHMSIVPPMHGNTGRCGQKTNLLVNRGVIEKLVGFMLALAEAQGEYSPGRDTKSGSTQEDKNPDILWLPACLTRSAIVRMYNAQHPDFQISRTAFCLRLENDPRLRHIKIRSPRTDMCDFCELQKRRIAGTKPHDEAEAEKLTADLAAHQKAYQGERTLYNAERKQAKTDRKQFRMGTLRVDECTEHISMDYGQSIDVPHTADQLGGTFYLHMRNFHLFGLCSILENRQIFYTYDEREAGKGANEVISFLHDFFANRTIQTPNIRLHADNCRGQNKNKYVMWYLLWLAATERVKRIEFKFMMKGHTHFIVDSGIGHAKQELRRSDVFCLNHWAAIINQSATANTAKVVDASYVYDWKNALQPYFKTFAGISKFQHFAVDSAEPGWLLTRYGFAESVWEKRKLLKSDRSLNTEEFNNLPQYLSTVGFKGGKPAKENALFENLRQYVRDEWKDELCPDPSTFIPPVRDTRPCPDWS